MSDISTCPLPELITEFRKNADKADRENDFLRCLLMNSIANRFMNAHNEIEDLKRKITQLEAKIAG